MAWIWLSISNCPQCHERKTKILELLCMTATLTPKWKNRPHFSRPKRTISHHSCFWHLWTDARWRFWFKDSRRATLTLKSRDEADIFKADILQKPQGCRPFSNPQSMDGATVLPWVPKQLCKCKYHCYLVGIKARLLLLNLKFNKLLLQLTFQARLRCLMSSYSTENLFPLPLNFCHILKANFKTSAFIIIGNHQQAPLSFRPQLWDPASTMTGLFKFHELNPTWRDTRLRLRPEDIWGALRCLG